MAELAFDQHGADALTRLENYPTKESLLARVNAALDALERDPASPAYADTDSRTASGALP